MNPNDEIRQQMLQWFHDRNKNATSQMGKRGSAVKISDVKKGLKEAYGLTQKQVMANLTYLRDKGWVNQREVEKTVVVPGGTVPSTTTWYEISAEGIDKIEGGSAFQDVPRYAGININATGANVITLGDGNVVNAEYQDLDAELGAVKASIAQAESITEAQKLDATADVETIRGQLAKPKPDSTIVSRAWERVQQVGTIGGFVSALAKAAVLIESLL